MPLTKKYAKRLIKEMKAHDAGYSRKDNKMIINVWRYNLKRMDYYYD